jgi:hypothetical protein
MEEKPIECENTHKWEQISNASVLPLIMRSGLGGTSNNCITFEIWHCKICKNLRFFSNEPQ